MNGILPAWTTILIPKSDSDFILVFGFVGLMELFRSSSFFSSLYFFSFLICPPLQSCSFSPCLFFFAAFCVFSLSDLPQPFGWTKEWYHFVFGSVLCWPVLHSKYVNSLTSNLPFSCPFVRSVSLLFHPKWNVFIAFQWQITICGGESISF